MKLDKNIMSTLDHIDAPIFVLERDGNDEPIYAAINAAIRDRTKFSLEQCIGKTAKQLYPGQFGELAYKYHCECMATAKKITYDLTIQLEGKDVHTRTTLSPILDSENKVKQIVGTANIVNAEYYIQEANAKALTQNAENAQLINLSAHDLRSPMRNMKSLTEFLRDGFVDLGDGKLELVDMLKKLSVDTIALIGNIIDFAQSTNATETVEEFQLTPICRKILSVLDPYNKHRAVISDAMINGDKTATEIALRNLIDNAFKHNSGKNITIEVCASRLNKEMFQISVSDNGCGMDDPSDLVKKEVPYKIDGGYGFFGACRLLRSRGGDISAATPADGKGLQVTFSLPGNIVRNLG